MANVIKQYNNVHVEDDGLIYVTSYNGGKERIGATSERYNTLADECDGYKDICIEAGLIEEEKTAGEINKELKQEMAQMRAETTEQIGQLTNLVAQLLQGGGQNGNVTGHNEVGAQESKTVQSGKKTSTRKRVINEPQTVDNE